MPLCGTGFATPCAGRGLQPRPEPFNHVPRQEVKRSERVE